MGLITPPLPSGRAISVTVNGSPSGSLSAVPVLVAPPPSVLEPVNRLPEAVVCSSAMPFVSLIAVGAWLMPWMVMVSCAVSVVVPSDTV